MAIYHFTAKVIKRSHGRSAVAAAAYRSGDRFIDEERGRTFDYTYKSEVIHSEILLPERAPEWMNDRQKLWNAVEAREQRRDAQVAREVEFALPQELSQADAIGLARDYVRDGVRQPRDGGGPQHPLGTGQSARPCDADHARSHA